MAEKCCACSKDFKEEDSVVTFYMEKVKKGEKSGQLGFYPHEGYPETYVERVHFTYPCLEKCFSPADNPFLYDSIALNIRKEVMDDIRHEVYDEINIELGDDDMPKIPDIDDPPFCLWCKKKETVWVQIRPGGCIYACPPCGKYWDEEENEIDQTGRAA